MNDETELKPCPFCGGAVKLEQTRSQRSSPHDHGWGVVCRSGLGLGGTCAIEQVPSATKEAAIERWNKRAKTPKLPQWVENLMLLSVVGGTNIRLSPQQCDEVLSALSIPIPEFSTENMLDLRTGTSIIKNGQRIDPHDFYVDLHRQNDDLAQPVQPTLDQIRKFHLSDMDNLS